jgi:hypothetical protein
MDLMFSIFDFGGQEMLFVFIILLLLFEQHERKNRQKN